MAKQTLLCSRMVRQHHAIVLHAQEDRLKKKFRSVTAKLSAVQNGAKAAGHSGRYSAMC